MSQKKFESKLKEIVQKRSKAEEKYTTAFTIFKHILNNEKALREELIEVS